MTDCPWDARWRIKWRRLPRSSPSIFDVRYPVCAVLGWTRSDAGRSKRCCQLKTREMGSTIPKALSRVSANPEYQSRFAAAYGELTASSLARVIAAFGRSVIANDAPVDRYLQGDSAAFVKDAAAGFKIYWKAQCSFCHYVPLFNGVGTGVSSTIPCNRRSRAQPGPAHQRPLDAVTRDPRHRHAFGTPTLRNGAKTAPYMHNGRLQTTLEQVIDFL